MKMKKFCKSFASEFQCKNFGFEHSKVEEFYRSQWQTGERNLPYFIYRWIWFIFFFCVFASILILQFCEGKVFIFLTNWGIILCLLANLFGAILVTRWYFDIGSTRTAPLPVSIESNSSMEKLQRTPILVKFYWLSHSIALPLALTITMVYWTFLYGKMNKPMRFPILSFVTHCLNSVFMVIDFWVVAFPMRLLHTVYAMLLPIIFSLFTVAYYFAGGSDEYGNPYVYPIIHWQYPGRGLTTFAAVFVLYMILGVFLFCLYRFKRLIHSRLQRWKPHSVDLY